MTEHGSSRQAAPEYPEPNLAERARTLMHVGGISSLCTLSDKHKGYPFGSVMPYVVDEVGSPIFLISSMAMHTHNIKSDPRCTLLVQEPIDEDSPLGIARISVMGHVSQANDEHRPGLRELYLQRHAYASYWADFKDFAFYRMVVSDVYFVGGFGVMGWIKSEDYTQAMPDPLADVAHNIIQHMNADHGEAMIRLARYFSQLEATEATMTSVDRLGFHCRLQTAEGVRGVRIPFSRTLATAQEVREDLVSLIEQIRKKS